MVSERSKRLLFVEGGGDKNPSLASECRKAFSKLFDRAGIAQRPRVIACGGRQRAFDQFRDAHEAGKSEVWLLIDAEEVPAFGANHTPWDHVKNRAGDGWVRPDGARDHQLHLMNVCMETWLCADSAALKQVFGPNFDGSKLPTAAQLETTEKQAIYKALEAATKPTKAGPYGKGSHSFKTLEKVSPDSVCELSWGRRFFDAMGAA